MLITSNERERLIALIDKLDFQGRQKLAIFLAGLEARKVAARETEAQQPKTPDR